MEFFLVLAATIVLTFLMSKPLKKYPAVFYLLSLVLVGLYIANVYLSFPAILKSALFLLMQKCTLSLAMFVVVMYIGVFHKDSWVSQKLRPVRAELSIMACILALGHMAVYLSSYLPRLLSGTVLDASFIFFFVTAIVLLVLLAVLGVTSLQAIKARMGATTWKKVQKWAYVFFGLIYVHMVAILLPSALSGGLTAQVSVISYTVLFGLYAGLRVYRWLADKKVNTVPSNETCPEV